MSAPDPFLADRLAFVAAIADFPDDDTPRLIFADWLDEHGDPARAEFVRLQCRMAAMPFDDPERYPLLIRERELYHAHERGWRTELPAWAMPLGGFHRGFVSEVECSLTELLADDTSLLRLTPLMHLRLRQLDDRFAQLAQREWLRGIQTIRAYGGRLSNAALLDFLAGGDLRNLRTLQLGRCDLDDDAVVSLAASPKLAGLRVLDLGGSPVGEDAVAALIGSPYLARIERLVAFPNLRAPATRRHSERFTAEAARRLTEHFGDRWRRW